MAGEQNPNEPSPGVIIMADLVKSLVMLQKSVVDLRETIEAHTVLLAKNHESTDELVGFFNVMSRTVELMADTKRKPNWADFLDCWAQADHEEFGEEDDEDEDPNKPEPSADGGGNRRHRIVN